MCSDGQLCPLGAPQSTALANDMHAANATSTASPAAGVYGPELCPCARDISGLDVYYLRRRQNALSAPPIFGATPPLGCTAGRPTSHRNTAQFGVRVASWLPATVAASSAHGARLGATETPPGRAETRSRVVECAVSIVKPSFWGGVYLVEFLRP